jgi:hypothetical protein
MKNVQLNYLLFALLLLSSCKQPQQGKINVTNGEGILVNVPYEIAILSYDELSKKINKDDFKIITEKASSEAKMKCKFLPTYNPKGFSYMIEQDTITVIVTFHAKNALGVSNSEISFSKFLGNKFIGTL